MTDPWLGAVPTFIAALGVVFIPGLGIAWALRVRGLALVALAPAGTVVTLSGLAIVFGALGIPWNLLSTATGCLVVIAAAWTAGVLLRAGTWPTYSRSGLVAWSIAVGGLLLAVRAGMFIGKPDAISQTNDAVFHLNALRWIEETGSASSFDLSGVNGSSVFYPGGWHAVASVIAQLSTDTPSAVNMLSIIIAALVWPLGIAWLTREASSSGAAAAVAAVLSAALLAFPMLMMQWGVLYPYLLSVAILPASVAVVISAPGTMREHTDRSGRARTAVRVALLTAGAAGAVAIAQPSTLLVWAILVGCFGLWWAGMRARSRTRRTRLLLVAVASTVAACVFVTWFAFARATTGAHWSPFRGKGRALVDIVLNAQVDLPIGINVIVSLFVAVGLVTAIRRPALRWLATAWAVLALLYFAVASVEDPVVRRWLLGPWYADPYRIAALAPVAVIPLAAIGLLACATWLAALLARRTGNGGQPTASAWAVTAGAVVSVVGLAAAPVVPMPKLYEAPDGELQYASGPDSWLSDDERALLERLDDLVPDDARVIGNPSTGSGFGYFLSGRDVFPRSWAQPQTLSWSVISARLKDAELDAAVCEALSVYGSPDFVLDFGPGEATPGRFILPGMTEFDDRPGFELVAREGNASLWRITACR